MSAAPGEAEALYRRGLEEQAAGRLDAAIGCFDAALRARPDFPEALCSGGYILQSRGHAAGALAFYERALHFNPDYAVAWFNRGGLLLAQGDAGAALACFESACALQPKDAGAFCNRGAALYALGRLAEAAQCCRDALQIRPDLPQAELNLGNALMRLGLYGEARQAYLRAIVLRKNYPLAFCGLGIVAKEMGRFGEAMEAFDEALRLAPDLPEARSNKGCLQLLLGDFAQGWEGYEHRWAEGQRPAPASPARFDLADPASIAGRKILVVHDHGLGDAIQFYRYVALLARAGAEVAFAGPARLRRLLASSGARVAWRDESDLAGDFDAVLALSSLPRACSTRVDAIPAPIPYLRAEQQRVALWRRRIAAPGPKIGLCWRGNIDFRVDPRRSIPPDAMMPLAGLEGVNLFSLQKGVEADELPAALAARLRRFDELLDVGPDAFVDTAALMNGLDLIVTCDTSIAHLAGALGRPVWLALRHVAEWRWLTGRGDSPWYPTMRLFRCGEDDDWTALFCEIADEIQRKFSD
ncbi:tetratricopeptide repeat protein [uncultured Rhodoblastus sp.]|uniref:tetratricopeptide repeat protein n=1 Tax=uncultured Rhodoblastus sp. TaxID=543037 RepID=UPI0025E4B91B|nr:tetratricopeptide repeat protein [uncultured Rhodoblastus sp.]